MKKLTFKKSFLLLIAVYALALIVGLLCFWQYLKKYEKTHPVGAMNAYFADIAAGDVDGVFADSAFPADAYNTKETYFSYVSQKYNNGKGNWQYALMDSDDTTLTYDVYESDEKHGTLTLTRDGEGFKVRSDWAYGAKTTLLSPQTVLVNGAPLAMGEKQTVSHFAGAKGELPTFASGTVETLLPPQIALQDAQTVLTEQADGTVLVTAAPKDAAAVKAFAETAAKTYALYISNDLERAELVALMEGGTSFASGVYAYDGKWYNKHKSAEFQNMQVSEPIMWAENAYTVEVRFDFVVSRTYDTHTYPTAYTVALRGTAGNYKIVNIAPL